MPLGKTKQNKKTILIDFPSNICYRALSLGSPFCFFLVLPLLSLAGACRVTLKNGFSSRTIRMLQNEDGTPGPLLCPAHMCFSIPFAKHPVFLTISNALSRYLSTRVGSKSKNQS